MIRIESIELETRDRVEVSGGEWLTYYRYGPGCWYVQMGQSDEPLNDCEEMEAAYQLFKRLAT